MKKLVYYTVILVCTSVFVLSCIGEDLSDCPPEGDSIVLQFKFIPNDVDSNPQIVNDSLYTATVYVFDEQDLFVTAYRIPGRPELNTIYTPDWGLPPGKYTYIAWLNHEHDSIQVDNYLPGVSKRTETQLRFSSNKIIDENNVDIPFLCYGHVGNLELKLDSIENNDLITIPIMQFTNRINLKVTGLSNPNNQGSVDPQAAQGSNYEFLISDDNAIYGFDGRFMPSDSISYRAVGSAGADTLNISLIVLKLSETKMPTFTIRNIGTNQSIISLRSNNNLIQEILNRYPDNNFDKNHVYDIKIDLPPNTDDIDTGINIIDWEKEQIDSGLDIN
jgi:hypothetical protein